MRPTCQDFGGASELTMNAQCVASALDVYSSHAERMQSAYREHMLKQIQRKHALRMSGVLLASTFNRQVPRTFLCMHKNPDAHSE